jgi:Organic solute transporter Ostalpha
MSPRAKLFGGGASSSNSSSSGGVLSGLFGSSSSNATCSGTPASYFDTDPVTGSWTLQKLLTVTAAPLTAITAIVCLALAMSHLANFTIPHQQRQLVRVTIVPAVFAIFSILGLCFYRDSNYVVAVADFYEIYALVGFFYYLISVVAPDETTRLEFFQQLDAQEKDGSTQPGGGLRWLYVRSPKRAQIPKLTPSRDNGSPSSNCCPAGLSAPSPRSSSTASSAPSATPSASCCSSSTSSTPFR